MAGEEKNMNEEGRPDARTVINMHTNSDVDSSTEAQHHTIGIGPNQAASGGHDHRGGNGRPIFEGMSLTGTKTGTNSTLLGSIVAALIELGIEDKTT